VIPPFLRLDFMLTKISAGGWLILWKWVLRWWCCVLYLWAVVTVYGSQLSTSMDVTRPTLCPKRSDHNPSEPETAGQGSRAAGQADRQGEELAGLAPFHLITTPYGSKLPTFLPQSNRNHAMNYSQHTGQLTITIPV
jgi:hypothetical protein